MGHVAYRKRDSSWVGIIKEFQSIEGRAIVKSYTVEMAAPFGEIPASLDFPSFGAAEAYVDAMYNNQDGDHIQLPPAPDPWRARRPGEEVIPAEVEHGYPGMALPTAQSV
jgi:hypothetical protein